MGVTDYLVNIKDWTLHKLWKGKNDDELNAQHLPNLGEDIRKVVQTQEFENVMNSASPFLLTCLGAWPGYWIYRGFDYHSHRPYVPLPMYIRQVNILPPFDLFILISFIFPDLLSSKTFANNYYDGRNRTHC